MLPPIHVPASRAGLAITALQCLNLLSFANEKQTPTGYSKFAGKTASIPSRRGMMIIYTPALVTSAALFATAPVVNGREALVAGLLAVHFAKRVGEVLLVHRYSGAMGPMCYFISTFYALLSLLICVQTQNVPPAVYAAPGSEAALPVALGLFAVGQLGNLYHHMLLAGMRSSEAPAPEEVAVTPTSKDALAATATPAQQPMPPQAYRVPRGGLFEYAAAPHYLFEIVAWLGVALAAQQLNAFLVTAGMASYLSGRAVASSAWYKKQFGAAYPAERKHMVPFVF